MNDTPRRQPMRTAPRDGSLVLVAIRATEQGPEEFDMVRWASSARSGEEGWVATDSDPEARVVYATAELAGWMPLPTQVPKLRAHPAPTPPAEDDTPEGDGSGM